MLSGRCLGEQALGRDTVPSSLAVSSFTLPAGLLSPEPGSSSSSSSSSADSLGHVCGKWRRTWSLALSTCSQWSSWGGARGCSPAEALLWWAPGSLVGLSCWSQGWSQTVNLMQGWERRKQGNSQGKWKVMSFDKTGEEHLHPGENWPLALLSSRHWPTERLEGMMDDSEWEMTCLGSHSDSVLCLQVWLGGSLGKQKVGRGVCGHVWTNSSHKSLSWTLKMDACRLIHFARWINAGGKVLS